MSDDPLQIPRDKPILLFDGVCNLCDGLVQFIIKRDPEARFRFTALQSEAGQALLGEAGMDASALNTVVMFDDGQFYTHSDVPLQIAWQLGGFWRIFYIFKTIPKWIRDRIYDWIASNRYKWFGKKESCMIPTPELKQRFI
ncbi:MAG: thiol-disulfide oxidoreductase DCC family protein [Saprospiraceae bacterium]|nr:thiol-disulfide oxidoreductase DCC family protein [Saprospiraceae bacterium]